MTDAEALDRIASLMSSEVWEPDTLDAIADCLSATGRDIYDINTETDDHK